MDVLRYLEDLKNYCEKNHICFAKCSKKQQLEHIRNMLKYIAHNTSQVKL